MKVDNLDAGMVGLMGDPDLGNDEVRDVLVLACKYDGDQRFSQFENKNGAVCVTVYTDEKGNFSPRLLGINNAADDWVYIPESMPILMINPKTRRKSRFAKPIANRNSIYLTDDGGACLFASFGVVNLKNLDLTHVVEDRAYVMSINEWGFFETLHNSSKPFWP